MRLIDADALIEKCGEWYVEEGPETGFIGTVKMMVDEMLTIVAEPDWISCSEDLPKTDEVMLVTTQPKKGAPNVNRAYYMNGSWHGSGSMSNVTAWMPMPEPYRGE